MSEPDDAGRTQGAPGPGPHPPPSPAPPSAADPGWSWGTQQPEHLGYQGAPTAPGGPTPPSPQYGQPQYGAPQYGQPQYGQPQQTYAPAPRPGVIPLRPLSLGEIFDGAFRSIRANPRVMFGFAAIVVSIAVLIQLVIQWYTFGGFGDLMLDPTMQDADAVLDGLTPLLAGTLVSTGITMLATTILTGILIVSVSRSVIGENLSLGQVWAHTRPQVWRLILLTLLLGVIIVAAPAAWFSGGIALLAGGAEGAGTAVMLIGIPLAIVWFAWVFIRTLLTTPALMLERLTVIGGLTRGWRLSRGVFWRLLGIYLLTAIIVYFVASVVAAPASFASVFLGPEAFTSPLGLAIIGVSTLLGSVLTTPFTAAVVALLYVDTRIRREGLDVQLARAAEAVGTGPTGWGRS